MSDLVERLRAHAAWREHMSPKDTGVNVMREAAAELTRLREQLAAAEKDARRMDWLESEFTREGAWLSGDRATPMPRSLFRANLSITRAAIDAAMSEEKLLAAHGPDGGVVPVGALVVEPDHGPAPGQKISARPAG